MYPLLLKPPVKDYLWGGSKLKNEYGFEAEGDIAAEAWVLSCHKDGQSEVINGSLKGKTLSEALESFGLDAIGSRAQKFPYFPLLIKLIDAKQKLSVQVHPKDDYALKNEGEFGKTEMWFVVDCEEGAELIYGFKEDISKAEFEERIKNNTLTEVCNTVRVSKGDVFFISAGTLHAIGEGILIAEVQQNSNTTYRVSDYGRLGSDGKPRPLHIEKALAVTECKRPVMPFGQVGDIKNCGCGTVRRLASCEYFTADLLELDGTATLWEEDSFVSVLVLGGEMTLDWSEGSLRLKKGSSVFVPAGLKVTLSGKGTAMTARV